MFPSKFLRLSRCSRRRLCTKVQFDKVIFSGIQPSGVLHLGNYFGAIKKWTELQNDSSVTKMYISVVDLHALTSFKSPEELGKNIKLMTASLLACGIDPEKCVLFQQSAIPNHTLLTWILSVHATMPRLSQLPNFKEKSAKYAKEGDVPLSLFAYPVLQAADILLYKATHVPVGEDQTTHMVMTRKLASHFNSKYSTTFFPIPNTIESKVNRLKSLRDPSKKMSKSDDDSKSCIYIDDSPSVVIEKCKKALTDMTSRVTFEPETRAGVANLITIHAAVTDKTVEQIVAESSTLTTAEFKLAVGNAINEKLAPIQAKLSKYVGDPDYLEGVLWEGNKKARIDAERTMEDVRRIVGMTF